MTEPIEPSSSEPSPTFDALALTQETRKAVDELGYTHPTPVQSAVFELARRGEDLVVQARTGTGKTSAFGLPIVDGLVQSDAPEVQALILCPTRELALQVTRELVALGRYRSIQVGAVYGGAPMGRQIDLIQQGLQVLVGTPGRVLDHIRRKTLSLARVRTFVLDESDEMLSMGFLPQITEIWSALPKGHQTLLFSATLPPDIQRVAESRLRNPELITLSGDQVGALEIRHFVYITPADKLDALVRIVEAENPESAIVFCNTRDQTKRVAHALSQQGYQADWLNADLAQNEREKVMAATREGNLRYLVATDVAARGIDISHLTHVINFDFPESSEGYVHRTGRTGRAGRTGDAISLIAPSDIGHLYMLRLTYKIFPIERSLPSARELKSREEADLVNLFVNAFSARRIHPDDLALARRVLSHEQSERVVAGLLRDHLGARPEAAEEATAERRAKPPRPVSDDRAAPAADGAGHVDPRLVDEGHRGGRRDKGSRKKKPEPSSKQGPSKKEGSKKPKRADGEVFVNVGRKHGARRRDFEELLEERGFEQDEIEYVNVRQGHTFVGVSRDLMQRALDALDGTTISGRAVAAEPARSGQGHG